MKLDYKTYGDNNRETIIFLHSGLQTGDNDFGHIVDSFSDKYSVILPNLLGHGKSHIDDFSRYSLNPYLYFMDNADAIKELLDDLHITRVQLVGVSLGALVAVNFALRYKSYVSSVTVSGMMFSRPDNYMQMLENDRMNMNMLKESDEAKEYLNNLHDSDWSGFIDMANHRDWYPFEDNTEFLDLGVRKYALLGQNAAHEIKTIHKSKAGNINLKVIKKASHLVNHENSKDYIKELKRIL